MAKFTPTHLSFIFLFLLNLRFVDISAQTATVPVNYDFNASTGTTIDPKSFGINVFQGFNPNIAGNPGNALYKAGMNEINPGIIRYHSWEMLGQSTSNNGWLKADQEWDAVKINNAMSNSYSSNPEKMMNIPQWPNKMMQTGTELLRIDQYNNFAAWCASLVKIINIDQKRAVKYWEIPNERDGLYGGNPSMHGELARIYNLAAKAMKAVDPTIKIGGPAFAQPHVLIHVDSFCRVAYPNIDFLSYHTYSIGTSCGGNADDATVLDKANVGWATNGMRNIFKKYSNKTIEYFHDEFNISYCPPDVRQNNGIGMIYDALLMKDVINAGAMTMAWNECDGWYGKMGGNYDYRPSLFLFKNWNAHLRNGVIYQSTSGNETKIVTWAIKKGTKLYMVAINRALSDVNVKFDITGLPSSVNNTTYFINHENTFTGGITDKKFTLGQMTSATGILIPNGTVALFELDLAIISGIQSSEGIETTTVYPNPAKGNLYVKYFSKTTQDVVLRLKSSLSNEIAEEKYKVAQGLNEIPFGLKDIPSGIYFLEIIGTGQAELVKIIIEK